jgi:hypothetical protein
MVAHRAKRESLRLEETGELAALTAMNVNDAFEYLWPELRTLTAV